MPHDYGQEDRRDSQRSKEYKWEWALEKEAQLKKEKLTFKQCRVLMEVVWLDTTGGHEYCDTTQTRPPRLKKAHGLRRSSCFRVFPPVIELTKWGHNAMTVLHEVGHAIMRKSEFKTGQFKILPAHGPHFVTLVMRLYEKYLGFNRAAMEQSARERRLKFVCDEELDAFFNRQPTNSSEATTQGG